MTIYIEYVLVDNFTTTYLIGKLSYRLLRLSENRARYIAASVLGTAAAFVYPLLDFNAVLLFFLRIVLWLLLSLILFAGKKKFFSSALVFLSVTFIFGGAMIAIGYMIYGNMKSALTLPPFDFPYGLCLVGVYSVYLVVKKLLEKIKMRIETSTGKRRFTIEVLDKKFVGEGLVDTGNFLTDRGLPVVILGAKAAGKLLNSDQFAKVLLGKGENISYDSHYIESTTLTKKQKILIVSNGKIQLYSKDKTNINITVSVGISLSLNSYDAILSPQILYASEETK